MQNILYCVGVVVGGVVACVLLLVQQTVGVTCILDIQWDGTVVVSTGTTLVQSPADARTAMYLYAVVGFAGHCGFKLRVPDNPYRVFHCCKRYILLQS